MAVTSSDVGDAGRCLEALASHADTRQITPEALPQPPCVVLEGAGGLLLGGGSDADLTTSYGGPEPEVTPGPRSELDRLYLRLLRWALDQGMPVLATGRGMQFLNLAMGGGLPRDVPGHGAVLADGGWESARHSIYLSPGSKMAAILGMGGFFRVNSRHRQGLREAQKSPRLLASAYSLEDGVIEGLESPEHAWVLALQCHPERMDEVPKSFSNLFAGLGERAEAYIRSTRVHGGP